MNSTFSPHRALRWMAKIVITVSALACPLTVQAQTLTSVSPTIGQEGDTFTIQGSGFESVAANHSVLINDGSRSVLAEVISADPNKLTCRLGIVASPMTGEVQVRTGSRTYFPSWTLLSGSQIFEIDGLSWFEGMGVAEDLNYTASPASPQTTEGARDQAELVLDLDPLLLFVPGVALVRIDIETGVNSGDSSDHPGGESSEELRKSSAQPILEARLRMTRQSQTLLTPNELATAIAKALNHSFAAEGLSAVAQDRKIRIGHADWDATTETYAHLQLVPAAPRQR